MRAWLLDDFKGLDALRLSAEAPRQIASNEEVLVRVHFAALNPADRFLAENLYPARPPLPHILGRDGMGIVEAIGPGVTRRRVGDRVVLLRGDCGVNRWGTLAEYVVVPQDGTALVPNQWTPQQAAAAPLVYLTAHQALHQWGPLAKATVLITGASGGVGVASIHLAKSLGHRVIGLSRGTAKRDQLFECGCDLVIDPADEQLKKKVKDFTTGRGVDLAIDNIAGPLFNTLLDVLGYGGRISVVGMLAGNVPSFSTAKLLFRRIRIGGVQVGDQTPQEAQRHWNDIVTLLTRDGKKPVVDSTFPFTDLRPAFDRLAVGPFGKVLIAVNS